MMKQDHYEQKYTEYLKHLVLEITSEIDCSLFLFGSRCRGEQNRSSDFDIGFRNIENSSFIRIKNHLLDELEESIIPYHIDIINFDTVDSSFMKTAMTGAIVWKQSSHEK